MFNKKCSKCARKISKDFEFCPYCGHNMHKEENERDFGFLGKDDFIDMNSMFNPGISGQDNSIFDKLMKNAMKMLQDDVQKQAKMPEDLSNMKFQLFINGKKVELPNMTVNPGSQEKQLIKNNFSEEKALSSKKLPRKEAETKVRRMSNKVVYEIELPGVSSPENIVISKLENSLEIKAFSSEKVYFKLLPILPILGYKLANEKLILELKAK